MDQDLLAQHVRSFQRDRDPSALAAVFDATAPRLLLVAMHLVRDGAKAEDLVQTVFLQALRDVDRCEPHRVLPWLLVILEHRAIDMRRHDAVRRERELSDGPSSAIDQNPADAAIRTETRERVAEALAGMPHDHRDVLTLRLVHGLRAIAIAQSLGVPPATVRSRLRRGLELLRGALPRGLATPAVLGWLSAEALRARDGLKVVRSRVLAAAGAGGGAGAAVVWSWLTAILIVGVAMWSSLAGGAALNVASGVDRVQERADLAKSTDDAGGAAALDPSARRSVTPAEPTTESRTHLHGRVVAAESGVGLLGIAIHARLFPRQWTSGFATRTQLVASTDMNGAFAFDLVTPGRDFGIAFEFTGELRVPSSVAFASLRANVRADLGTIELAAGSPVQVKVHRGGEPWPGVRVAFGRRVDDVDPMGMALHTTDAVGSISLGCLEPGEWCYRIEADVQNPRGRFQVPQQSAPMNVAIDAQDLPRDSSIRGIVVDAAGGPVAGVNLGIRMKYGHHAVRTDGAGRFAFARRTGAPEPATLELLHPTRGLGFLTAPEPCAWGGLDQRLVVQRPVPAELRLEVVDAATGSPVELFGATCRPDLWREPGEDLLPDFSAVEPTMHAGGVVEFNVMQPGAAFVSVFAPPFADATEIPIELTGGQSRSLRIALELPAELVVDVVDHASGSPVVGAAVTLARVVPGDDERTATLATHRTRRGGPCSSGANILELARGMTDVSGRVVLHARAATPAMVLIVEGAVVQPVLVHGIELPQLGTHRIVSVQRAARVRGRVVPVAFVERFGPTPAALAAVADRNRIEHVPANELASDYPEVLLRGPYGTIRSRLEPDGSFVVGSVPPGRHEIRLHAFVREGDGSRQGIELGPFGSVEVSPECAVEPLVVDASGQVPGRLSLRVFVDGQPFRGAIALRSTAAHVRLRTDITGTAESPWVLPGSYLVAVEFEARVGTAAAFDPQPVVVAPGAEVAAVVRIERRPIVVELSDLDARVAAGRWLRLVALDAGALAGDFVVMQTDAAGRAEFAAAPPGRLQLWLLDEQHVDQRTPGAGTLLRELTAGEAAVHIRLPR